MITFTELHHYKILKLAKNYSCSVLEFELYVNGASEIALQQDHTVSHACSFRFSGEAWVILFLLFKRPPSIHSLVLTFPEFLNNLLQQVALVAFCVHISARNFVQLMLKVIVDETGKLKTIHHLAWGKKLYILSCNVF